MSRPCPHHSRALNARATDHTAGLAKVRAELAKRDRTPADHSEPVPARARAEKRAS